MLCISHIILKKYERTGRGGGELVIDMVLVYKAGGMVGCFTQSINMVQSSKAILLSALRKFDYLAKSLKMVFTGLSIYDRSGCMCSICKSY